MVDETNRVRTRAVITTEEHDVSVIDELAFFANSGDTAPTLSIADGNTYNLLYMENSDSERDLTIERIFLNADTTGIIFELIRNPVLGVVGANNVHVPKNLNFKSGKTANGIFHNWDETGTVGITGITGGELLNTYIVTDNPAILPIDGSFHLGQTNSFVIRATNNSGGNAEVAVGVRFYYELLENNH